MYFQPYGDDQQLNLNWIISEIINLHKQLDPDYETPSFTQVYPYSNLNRLNLDWVLSELKALKELAPEPTPIVDIQAVAEALVALPFDSNTSYQIYDFISRDGEIWRATEAIPSGGEWDSTKWFKTKIGTDLAVLERWINTINNSLTSEIQARQDADTVINQTIANLNNAGTDNLDDCNNFTLGIKKVVPATLNMPESTYGFIEGYSAQNNAWKWQILTTTQTPQKIFKRANINNAGWTPWIRIADNTDVESLQGSITSLGTQTNSVEWTPASGDTILAFILANCTRTKLPFSFVKKGTNTVSDVPTDINAKEFTGFVYGDGDRITVQINHYTNNLSAFFQRTIYQNNWYAGSWLTFTKSEQPKTITVTVGQYTVGGAQVGKWTNGIAEIQGSLQMSGYQSDSTIFSASRTLFKGNIFGLIFTDGGGKTWFPRIRDSETAIEVYLNTTLPDGWYNFFMVAFNDSF